MTRPKHIAYYEIDAMSLQHTSEIEELKDDIQYRSIGYPLKIVTLDECHMLPSAIQNKLLRTFEEGVKGVVFLLCTTDPARVLKTILSRCIQVNLKLVTPAEIVVRLRGVCAAENLAANEKALRIIATNSMGHVRDALMTLDAVSKMGEVSEDSVRTYLQLEKFNDVCELLAVTDRKLGLERLEHLLSICRVSELAGLIGRILVDAHKHRLAIGDYEQPDAGRLERVRAAHRSGLLDKAERVLSIDLDSDSSEYGAAGLSEILWPS